MCAHRDNITVANAAGNTWDGACSKRLGISNLAGAALPSVWQQLVLRFNKVYVLMQIIGQAQLSDILGCPRLGCTVKGKCASCIAQHCTEPRTGKASHDS